MAFPSVLKQLNEHLDWTQKLGDALISQQQDVATSIQRLRAKAAAAGTLKTGKEQTVSTQTQGSETIIAIQPTDPQVVYVPTYDPNTAYGEWPYPGYPPTYYPTGGALLRGLAWGVGIAAAGAMFGGWNWGYGGTGSYTNINVNRAANIDRNFNRANVGTGNRWQHDGSHRKGVAYRDPATRQQFGQTRPGADQRQQFRGQLDQAARPGGPGGVGGPGGAGRPVVSAVPVEQVALVVPAASVDPVVSVVPAVSAARVARVASAVPVVPVALAVPVGGSAGWRGRPGGVGGAGRPVASVVPVAPSGPVVVAANGLSGVNRGQQVIGNSSAAAPSSKGRAVRAAVVPGAAVAAAPGAAVVEEGDEQADP